jgi:hypothetical protein
MITRGTFLSKALAVGLLVLPIAAAWFAGAFALSQWRQGRDLIDEQIEQFERLRSVANFHGSATLVEENNFAAPTYLLGNEPSPVLAAELQSKLRMLASQHGVDIVQASDLKPEDGGNGFVRLGLHLEMTGRQDGIRAVLAEIESSVPWLFTDSIQFRGGFGGGLSYLEEPPSSLGFDIWGLVPAQVAKTETQQ